MGLLAARMVLVVVLLVLTGCGMGGTRDPDHAPPPGQEPWDPDGPQPETPRL